MGRGLIKKIKSTHNIVTVTFRAIDFNANFSDSEKKDYKKKLANSAISNLQDNFLFASSNCFEFTKNQKDLHNSFIHERFVYNPSILSFLCK